MPVKPKTTAARRKSGKKPTRKASGKNSSADCRITTQCSKAGRDLALLNTSSSGKKLNSPCKANKAKRRASGCLNGTKKKGTGSRKGYVEVVIRIPKSKLGK